MIRLNLSTDYALRTLLYLAMRPDRQVPTPEIVQFYDISADHLSKVVQHLAHGGLVRAGRGRTGGLRLGRPAAEITVGAVVELFEGPAVLLPCVNTENVCRIQPGCRLRDVLAQAGAQLMETLNAVTLAELVATPTSPLLQVAGLPLSPNEPQESGR